MRWCCKTTKVINQLWPDELTILHKSHISLCILLCHCAYVAVLTLLSPLHFHGHCAQPEEHARLLHSPEWHRNALGFGIPCFTWYCLKTDSRKNLWRKPQKGEQEKNNPQDSAACRMQNFQVQLQSSSNVTARLEDIHWKHRNTFHSKVAPPIWAEHVTSSIYCC